MSPADLRAGYLELIRQLGELRLIPFVFGGYAEDALLWGRTMRDHSDVDVMVQRSELDDRRRQFAKIGFEQFDTYYELVPGKPQVLNGERDGIHLEVSVLETDGERDYFFVDAPDGKRYRFYMESAAFDYPAFFDRRCKRADGVAAGAVPHSRESEDHAGVRGVPCAR